MVTVTELQQVQNDFASELNKRGEIIRLRYFTSTIGGGGSYYDDDVSLSRSGTDFYTSGMVQNLQTSAGRFRSNEALLVEQGRLKETDLKVYLAGTISLSGAVLRIGRGGSPPTTEYRVVDEGVVSYPFNGGTAYHKVFIRQLTGTGSLYGE